MADDRVTSAQDQAGQANPEPRPGLHVLAACEACGTWHSVEVKPMQENAEPITKVRPICWVCGRSPLATLGGGRV